MRDELVRRKVNPSRIDVIPNAIEALTDDVVESARRTSRERLGIGDDELILGYVGRLSTEKGLEHLIAALSLGSPVEGPWRLLIVGDGPERRALEAMATQARLDGRVTFAGFQSDASPWYAAMDALILPSLTEGTPMALLEAMAHRVAVIASAVGGVPAVVSGGVSGVLVPPGDRPALCRALRDVASSNTMRQSLAAAGQQTVRDRYNVCNWAAAVRRVYDKVLAHR
jgi:glycosyltransferase involved in cell wall biosynthesis